MSVLAYQEVARRIEELTRGIYELDPYFVLPPAPSEQTESVATLSMLVARGARAAAERRRPRERAPPGLAPAAAPAPAALNTYADIVRGCGSRSSSVGDHTRDVEQRPPSAQRLNEQRHRRPPGSQKQQEKDESTAPFITEQRPPSAQRQKDRRHQTDRRPHGSQKQHEKDESIVPSIAYEDYGSVTSVVRPSVDYEPPGDVCEPSDRYSETSVYDVSVSEPYRDDAHYVYQDFVSRTSPVAQVQEPYEQPMDYQIASREVFHQVESTQEVKDTPTQSAKGLQCSDQQQRAQSPATKSHSHELSYAAILALGLRRQANTQSVVSLPQPQVAQVELVREIVVEQVEKTPQIQQFEPRTERTESTTRLRPERPERPSQRSRSRDMPRQRRAPEKRPTKAHDVQVLKKKKVTKKVIEVQDFDDPIETVDIVERPTECTASVKTRVDEAVIETPTREITKKLQHSATVVEKVTELVAADDSPPENTRDEIEHKKSKKKYKPKKNKQEDEIEKALKEIEGKNKNKKKKAKESRDKSRENLVVAGEHDGSMVGQSIIEFENTTQDVIQQVPESKLFEIEIEAPVKQKKKKNQKDKLVTVGEDETEKEVTIEDPVATLVKDCIQKKKKKGNKEKVKPDNDQKTLSDITDFITNKSTKLTSEYDFVHSIETIQLTAEYKTANVESQEKSDKFIVDSLATTSNVDSYVSSESPIALKVASDVPETATNVVEADKIRPNVHSVDSATTKVSVKEPEDIEDKKDGVSFETIIEKADESMHKHDIITCVETVTHVSQSKKKKGQKGKNADDIPNMETSEFISIESTNEPEKEVIMPERVETETFIPVEETNKGAVSKQKKKKNKKHDKSPDNVTLETGQIIETVAEDVKAIEPIVVQTPNVVEQVDVAPDNVQVTVNMTPELTDVTELSSDSRGYKKKSKSKKIKPLEIKEQLEPVKVETEVPEESKDLESIAVGGDQMDEVKSNKKKSKSRKQKIDDDDIEKALKEIEQSEGTKKKPTKSKEKRPKNIAALDTVVFEKVKTKTHEASPPKPLAQSNESMDINDKLITMDWNALMEEEEIKQPTGHPQSLLHETTKQVATEVTILQETSNLLREEIENIVKECITESSTTTSEDREKSIKESQQSLEKVVEDEQKKSSIASISSSEQNNNDKFFSADSLKEGSINIVEEVTRYEPMKDPETRTIYLITHEEKKLPPIRTVKVFSSKSNSLEESSSFDENMSQVNEQVENKITDEESSIRLEKDNTEDVDISTTESGIMCLEETIDDSRGLNKMQKTKLESYEMKGSSIEKSSDVCTKSRETSVSAEITLTRTTSTEVTCEITEKSFTAHECSQTDAALIKQDEKSNRKDTTEMLISEGPKVVAQPELREETLVSGDVQKPEDAITVEHLNDFLEQAIFGSVQDRNRTKKDKQKINDFPYQELVDEVKTYSLDLDVDQLGYDYSQLMHKEKSRYNKDKVESLAEANIAEEQEKHHEVPVEEAPRRSYCDIVDAETSLIEQSAPTKPSIDVFRKYPIKEESPRFSYQELQDAESKLASMVSKEQIKEDKSLEKEAPKAVMLDMKTTEDILLQTVVKDTVETTQKTIVDHTHDLISSETYVSKSSVESLSPRQSVDKTDFVPTIITSETIKSVEKNMSDNDIKVKESKAAILYEKVPRHSYQEINNAEERFALSITIKQPVDDTQAEKHDESVLFSPDVKNILDIKTETLQKVSEQPIQNYHEIKDAECGLAAIKSREHSEEPSSAKESVAPPVPIQNVVETVATTITDQWSTTHDAVAVESTEIPITNGLRPRPIITEQVGNIYEVPRFSYHELNDAESLYAERLSRNEPILSQEHNNVSYVVMLSQPTEVISNVESYSSPVKIEEQSTTIISTETADKILDATSPDTLQGQVIFEPSRYSYHEIQDAERKLANLSTAKTEEKSQKENPADCAKSPEEKSSISESQETLPQSSVLGTEDTNLQNYSNKILATSKTVVDHTIDLINSEISEFEMTKNKPDATENIVTKIDMAVDLPITTPSAISYPVAIDDLETISHIDTSQNETVPVAKIEFSYEIDDIDETLVPVVFGDVKDVEKCFQKRQLQESNATEKGKGVIAAPDISEEFPVSLQAEIDKFVQFTDDVEDPNAKPQAVSVDGIHEISHSVFTLADTIPTKSLTPEKIDTPKQSRDSTSTDLSIEIYDVGKDSEQTIVTPTDNVRVEKSPIHSLHDLLPEIDSIPEFKPSFTNTVLYSNLSADAPEFTPSYMYRTVESTVSETKPTDITVGDIMPFTETLPQISPISVDAALDLVKPVAPSDDASLSEISYSSILQTKGQKQEVKPVIDEMVKQEPVATLHATAPEEATHEEHVDTKTKRSKKKKKKEDKKDAHIVNVPERVQQTTETPRIPDPVNVWEKAAEEGKSYAEVLAEGLLLSEQEEKELLLLESNISQQIPQRIEEVNDPSPTPITKGLDETIPESESVHSSWAKIVAANRMSPERGHKLDVQQSESVKTAYQPPVILVDETEFELHKPESEVDAEGFITVDRHRRSRSRSRDNRSRSKETSVSKKQDTREKSENRFEPLTSLKPEFIEIVQTIPLGDDKQPTKKGRKSRPSKSIEKEIKQIVSEVEPKEEIEPNIVEKETKASDVLATSKLEEGKRSTKKDKKKRTSKSKDKVRTLEKEEKVEPVDDVKEIVSVEIKQEHVEESVTQQPEVHESKKKSKKKKKKSESNVTETSEPMTGNVNNPLAQDVSSHNTTLETSQNVEVYKPQKKLSDTPVSTPDSLHTPIKERFYSEAQYWKVDPSGLSEIISVEIEQPIDEPKKQEPVEQPGTMLTRVDHKTSSSEFIKQETKTIVVEKQTPNLKITEEQSLEHKMADLQREIEEMLLPENDSLTSDDSPRELADTQTSADYHHDEIPDNIVPSLASPEPEEEYTLEHQVIQDTTSHISSYISPKDDEEIDDKHISMSMIDSLLEDTETTPVVVPPLQLIDDTKGTHQTEEMQNKSVQSELNITVSIKETKRVEIDPSGQTSDAPVSKPGKKATKEQKKQEKLSKQKDVLSKKLEAEDDTPSEEKQSVKIVDSKFVGSEATPVVFPPLDQINESPTPLTDKYPIVPTKLLIEQVTAKKSEPVVPKSKEPDSKPSNNEKSTKSTQNDVKSENSKDVMLSEEKHTVPSKALQSVTETKSLETEPQEVLVESQSSNIASTVITNNLLYLKDDKFWTDKHVVDDAERLVLEQTSSEFVTPIETVYLQSEHGDDKSVGENISNDNSFWPEKHVYHDAECQYFLQLARKSKTPPPNKIEFEITDQNDKDKGPGGGSGHSSETEEPRESSGSPFDSNYISMDLPGGICSWQDHSSYLSLETTVDSLGLSSEDARLGPDTREDILTTLPLEPVAPPLPAQETTGGEDTSQRTAKVTDPQSYCTILHFILYVWHDILTKFLISLITRLCIVKCRIAMPKPFVL